MKKIGLTTTVPIEILKVAGYKPIDLNNLFITSEKYFDYIDIAEKDGFPKSMCAWIKGIYGACLENNIDEVVGVMEGDCSNTKALIEVLKLRGIKIIPFSYPHKHTIEEVTKEINDFIKLFDVSYIEVEEKRKKLNNVRNLVKEIDLLTYKSNKISGFENHLYQVSCSDFDGDDDIYMENLKKIIKDIRQRQGNKKILRLGYIGVPPMTADIYNFVEEHQAKIIYNEVQREFAFPRANMACSIYEQYYDYTYPYDIAYRIKEIKEQIQIRNLDAIIHYSQAFCYRAIDNIILKDSLDIPILNIEGDKLNVLDARTKLRLEAFLDMLLDLKGASSI